MAGLDPAIHAFMPGGVMAVSSLPSPLPSAVFDAVLSRFSPFSTQFRSVSYQFGPGFRQFGPGFRQFRRSFVQFHAV
jgi:hypothetical protein